MGEDQPGDAMDAALPEGFGEFGDGVLVEHRVGVDAQIRVGERVLTEARGESVALAAVVGEPDEAETDSGPIELRAHLPDEGSGGLVGGAVVDDRQRLRRQCLRED